MMQELFDMLRPAWGAEKWILEGWNTLTDLEKQLIKNRMDDLFKDGLPFELKSDKLFYIYTFSFLAQLEVLAIQVPLKFESKMVTVDLQQRLHEQLLDEIFHGLVFTKIVYLLCAPYAVPPPYSPSIEFLCNSIRSEECPKVALILLNLVGEGWIEEIFYSLHRAEVAPKVFSVILEDEHRHVCEADLYREIGKPDSKDIKSKVAFLEEQLLTNIFMQYKYIFSVSFLLGPDGMSDFRKSLDKKHRNQLKKINIKPTWQWDSFMQCGDKILPQVERYIDKSYKVEMSPIRRILMTQWSDPSDPTMVGQFNLDISCLDFFNKKFPPETITCLMLQSMSHALSTTPSFRNYLNFKKLYQSKEAYVGLVVKLPDCGDHIGTIVFENCHLLNIQELVLKIKSVLQMMVYCYKKREELENTNDRVQQLMQEVIYDFDYSTYATPLPGSSFASLSNIGSCGYNQCKSPLRCNESLKLTLLEVERKPVWNKETHSFEPQDMLPISISADHRIFDGNLPIPKLIDDSFKKMFNQMLADLKQTPNFASKETNIKKIIDEFLEMNPEIAYKILFLLQTYWFDFVSIKEIESIISQETIMA